MTKRPYWLPEEEAAPSAKRLLLDTTPPGLAHPEERFREFWGEAAPPLIRLRDGDWIDPRAVAEISYVPGVALSTGAVVHGQVMVRCRTGTGAWDFIHACPFPDDAGGHEAALAYRDELAAQVNAARSGPSS
jgi:hypothetical protein